MAKATYYFRNGNGHLVGIPVDAGKDGSLADPANGAIMVTGAASAPAPADGCYVLDVPEKAEKPAKSKAAAAKEPAPDIVAEQQELEASADPPLAGKTLSTDLPPDA